MAFKNKHNRPMNALEESWGAKSDTNSNDLAGAIANFVYCHDDGNNDIENLDRFLNAIRPPTGWREEPGCTGFSVRESRDYDRLWNLIHVMTEEEIE